MRDGAAIIGTMKALTPKQEAYVRGLVSGMSQREAYRAAYRAEHMSDRTVDKKASALFCRGDIRGRFDALVAEAAKAAKWAREDAALVHRDSLERIDHYLKKLQDADEDLPAHILRERRETAAELCKLFRIYEAPTADDGRVVIVDDV